nr:MASE1 domain-containing protein [uncultured Sphingorhabdus sp.]
MAEGVFSKRSLGMAVGLYTACLFAAAFTELLWTIPGSGISIWLPAGIILATALATPKAQWALWVTAAVLAELTGNLVWYQHQIGPALLLAIGNSVAVLTGAYLIRSFVNSQQLLTSIRNTSVFIVAAGLVMPMLSATSGSVALGLSYQKPLTDAWIRIFLGDATGALIAAPLGLLIFGAAAPRLRLTHRVREASAFIVIFAIMAAISLGGFAPFAYLMIPPLLWASLSFRIPGAIFAILGITIFAALFTIAGLGPFARSLVYISYQNEALQLFLIVAATTGLLMGAIAEENRHSIRQLHVLNQTLEDRVAERSAILATTEAQAKATANMLSAISEACPDLIYAKDLNGRIIYANDATRKLLNGATIADLQKEGEENLYSHRVEYDPIRENDHIVFKTQKTLVAEEIVTDHTGVRRIFRSTKAPLFDSEGALSGLAGVSVDISDMIKIQAREKMLVREVEHRARNLLAVVQGIVALTKADSVADMKSSLSKRIRALATTNGAIAASNWEGAELLDILSNELAPYKSDDGANIVLEGPSTLLEPATAQSVTLIVHELTTNAAKYGCLSASAGKLEVQWSVKSVPHGEDVLSLYWRERGGPPVVMPKKEGFGTTVIGVFGQERPGSSVDFAWETDGLHVSLVMPLPKIRTAL